MKLTLDIKSILTGILIAGIGMAITSGKNLEEPTEGRYRTEVNNNNVVVIIDTHTGRFLIAPQMQAAGKVQWIKGEFQQTFNVAKDNKKE
jgi:hypothetical protein